MPDTEITLEEALEKIDRLESLVADIPTREDLIAELLAERVEQECIRCHHRFTGFEDDKFCTRDCANRLSDAPQYEDWYRTMHPQHPRVKVRQRVAK